MKDLCATCYKEIELKEVSLESNYCWDCKHAP